MEAALLAEVRGMFAAGKFAEAGPRLEPAASAGDGEAMHYLGIVRCEAGHREEGRELIEASIAVLPGRADFEYHLGNALDAEGRVEEAAAAYRRALELRPNYPQAMMNLGIALQTLGKPDEAAEVLKALVAIAPRSPSAHLNLGRMHYLARRDEEAVPLLRRAAELDNKAMTLAFLSKPLDRLDRKEERDQVRDQAMAIAPPEAAVWLGLAQMFAEDGPRAAACLRRVLELDPGNEEAAFLVAAAEGKDPPAPPPSYVASLFDSYATHFDAHLVDKLDYQAPQLVRAAIERQLGPGGDGPVPPLDILDAGCGTGLAAPLLKPWARRLVGVDLSTKMVQQASLKKIYDALAVEELGAFLRRSPLAYDLIAAVDVLVYIGDLRAVFAAAAAALRPGGLFAFSVETRDIESFTLLSSHRYAHGVAYLQALLEPSGFSELENNLAILRKEGAQPVFGQVVLWQKTAGGQ